MALLVDTGDPNQHMAVAGEFGRHRLYKMLGYFSLVGLLRLHSLLGDYHQALRVIENMNVNRKVLSQYMCDVCSFFLQIKDTCRPVHYIFVLWFLSSSSSFFLSFFLT